MIRGLLSVFPKSIQSGFFSRSFQPRSELLKCSSKSGQNANFTSLTPGAASPTYSASQIIAKYTKPEFLVPKLAPADQIRTVIKFSWSKARRKTVKTVLKRYYRLHWGIWIRAMAGRKGLPFKRDRRRRRLQDIVFFNAQQSRTLDKMVNKFWRKPKYYINDPFEVYNTRENFVMARKKPWRPEGVDYE